MSVLLLLQYRHKKTAHWFARFQRWGRDSNSCPYFPYYQPLWEIFPKVVEQWQNLFNKGRTFWNQSNASDYTQIKIAFSYCNSQNFKRRLIFSQLSERSIDKTAHTSRKIKRGAKKRELIFNLLTPENQHFSTKTIKYHQISTGFHIFITAQTGLVYYCSISCND